MPPLPPPDGLARAGLYTFDIKVTGASHYDRDRLRSGSLSIPYVSHQNDLTIVYNRTSIVGGYYCLCSDKAATQSVLSFYDPLLQRMDEVLGNTVAGTRHREGLCGTLAYAGDYHIVVEAQDNHPESNKAHERRWALPLGTRLFVQPCAHYSFKNLGWFEDTDGEALKAYRELGEVFNPRLNRSALCYSGWYPLGEQGGVLVNKPRSHAFEEVASGIFKGTLLENAIWTFSGHGNRSGMLFGYNNRDSDSWLWRRDILRLPDGALSSIKVAVILSYYSAPEFVEALVQKGARAAVGFKNMISFLGGAYWNGWFWELLTKEGYTVGMAASEAKRRCRFIPFSGLHSFHVVGNAGQVIY